MPNEPFAGDRRAEWPLFLFRTVFLVTILQLGLLSVSITVMGLACVNDEYRTVADLDREAWHQAETADTIAAYEDYLRRQPEGEFASRARLRLEELLFAAASSQNTVKALEGYLKTHPHGRFLEDARSRLAVLVFAWAQIDGSIPTYQDFIDRFPNSPLRPDAEAYVRSILEERVAGLGSAKRIQISVSCDPPELDPGLEGAAICLAKQAGLQLVDAHETTAEDAALLKIVAHARTESAQYIFEGSGESVECITGGNLAGTLSLKYGPVNIRRSFSGTLRPADKILSYNCHRDILGVGVRLQVITSAYYRGYYREFLKLMAEAFGSRVLISYYFFCDNLIRVDHPILKLLDMEDGHVRDSFVRCLKHEDRDIREGAVRAFRVLRDPRAVDPLIAMLSDKALQIEAAYALGNQPYPLAGAALAEADTTGNISLYAVVAYALAQHKNPKAVDMLLALIEDPEKSDSLISGINVDQETVGGTAVKLLREITGKNFGRNAAQWRKWWEKNRHLPTLRLEIPRTADPF